MTKSAIGRTNFNLFFQPRFARLQRIVALIREGTGTGVYASAATCARDLAVSWRTVIRDLDWLRDDAGAPLAYDPSRKGFWLTDPHWRLAPLALSRREVFAFCAARKLAGAFRGTPLEAEVSAVLNKVAASLEGSATLDLESLTDRFTVIGEDYVRQDPRTWAKVAELIDRRERLRAVYEKFNGTVGAYDLEPYHLYAYHGNWYVAARNPAREGVATFALSRLRKVRGTGEFFEVPPTFDPARHMREAFGVVGGAEVLDVRLLFSSHVAAYVRERVWHSSQRMIERRNGAVELRLQTTGWQELVRWVLSWQPDCRVLAPRRLRERVAEKMRQALGRK